MAYWSPEPHSSFAFGFTSLSSPVLSNGTGGECVGADEPPRFARYSGVELVPLRSVRR